MAARRPLVADAGTIKEMPVGDAVPVAAGGTGGTTAGEARAALGVVVSLPFYTKAGALDVIPLTSDSKLPFLKANGSASNIPMTLA